MPLTIYGIKNCDTMKKARAWLDSTASLTTSTTTRPPASSGRKLEGWAKKVGWETLLNKAGTTFRKLPDKDKEGLTEKKAIALMLAQPSMIKRPVLELGGGKLLVGFKPEQYETALVWSLIASLRRTGYASADPQKQVVNHGNLTLRPLRHRHRRLQGHRLCHRRSALPSPAATSQSWRAGARRSMQP